MKLTILSALPVLGHPRDSKRIDMLLDGGFKVSAVAFDRNYHNARNPSCKIKILGVVEHGKYVSRIFKMARVLPLFRKEIKKCDVIYASGPDMALLSYISGMGLKKPIILEVGDIRKIQVDKGLKGFLMRCLDKFIVNKSAMLVATTDAFIDNYYRKWLGTKTPAMVIENKLERKIKSNLNELVEVEENVYTDYHLKIGYFGVLRCDWSWQILKELAISEKDKFEIVIAGVSMLKEDITNIAKEYDNIKFLGSYNSPQDLSKLYAKVDLIWGCYPSPNVIDKNWRWAQLICRSNRFYESCNFKRPIISMEGSGDAKVIEKFNIGKIIKNKEVNNALKVVSDISLKDVSVWKRNMFNLPEEVYVHTNEAEELKKRIYKIIVKS